MVNANKSKAADKERNREWEREWVKMRRFVAALFDTPSTSWIQRRFLCTAIAASHQWHFHRPSFVSLTKTLSAVPIGFPDFESSPTIKVNCISKDPSLLSFREDVLSVHVVPEACHYISLQMESGVNSLSEGRHAPGALGAFEFYCICLPACHLSISGVNVSTSWWRNSRRRSI